MRTTINVDEQLLVQAKAQAATLGVTLGRLIEDALRESLTRRAHVEQRGACTTEHYARYGHATWHRPRQQPHAPGDHGAMILMDVNILVYAHREDTPDHRA